MNQRKVCATTNACYDDEDDDDVDEDDEGVVVVDDDVNILHFRTRFSDVLVKMEVMLFSTHCVDLNDSNNNK